MLERSLAEPAGAVAGKPPSYNGAVSSSARRSSWIVLCGVLSMACVVAAPGITRAAKYHYYMWALRNRAGFLEKALDEREDKAMLSAVEDFLESDPGKARLLLQFIRMGSSGMETGGPPEVMLAFLRSRTVDTTIPRSIEREINARLDSLIGVPFAFREYPGFRFVIRPRHETLPPAQAKGLQEDEASAPVLLISKDSTP